MVALCLIISTHSSQLFAFRQKYQNAMGKKKKEEINTKTHTHTQKETNKQKMQWDGRSFIINQYKFCSNSSITFQNFPFMHSLYVLCIIFDDNGYLRL